MDIQDFKHHSKFKYIIPLVYVACFINIIFGPYFFPQVFKIIGFFIVTYSGLFKSFQQLYCNIILIFKSKKIFQRAQSGNNNKTSFFGHIDQQIYHAFVIPSYKQDIDLLAQTLSILSQHARATSSYLIFLAMQRHEEKSEEKALQLIETFKQKFKYIDYTVHQIRQFEAKGKASNVSWCVQHMDVKLKNLMIQQQKVFITVMDADSWAPNIYFDEVEDYIRKNYEIRHQYIFQPPQIYSRNNLQANIFVRTYDDMYSSMFVSNMVGCSNISFSLSNYTLSYSLIKKIGFWDTVEEAIGQDAHIVLKAFFKTNGAVQTVPIFVPWNQVCIITQKGFWTDVKAKFWQIQRHARGVCQLNYIVCMLTKKVPSFRVILMSLIFLQNLFNPVVSIYTGLYFVLAIHVFHNVQSDKIISQLSVLIVFNLTNFFLFVTQLMFEYFKRKSSKILYGIQSPSLIRVLQAPLAYAIHLFGMTGASFMIASFGNLFKNREYVVANKIYKKVQRIGKQLDIKQIEAQEQESQLKQQISN